MQDNSITFFPVSNGDTTLIRLPDGATILIDCHLCESGLYDVQTNLVRTLERDEQGRPHLNVFILTHPHEDHIQGFEQAFYVGAPANYSDKDKRAGRIIVDELWFAPRIFNEYKKDLCEDALAFRREAERRIDVYRSGSDKRSAVGNRLRVIGYSENDDVQGLEDILTIPGHTLNLLNGHTYLDFRFFIYAPVKRDTDSPDTKSNDTSIVVQARFDVDGIQNAARVFIGGDAECATWERIIDVNKNENLKWDLLLSPHHCSWTFFSSGPYDEDNPQPSEKILHLLGQKRGRAYIIASSKPIKDDDKNPPHYGAAQIYKKIVGKDHFLCTDEHPDEKNPKPIVFTMTANGPRKDDLPETGRTASLATATKATSTPRTYG